MKIITARPIDTDSFAPYGQLLNVPAKNGRYDFQAELFNGRSNATHGCSNATHATMQQLHCVYI